MNPTTLPPALAALADAFGGVEALAKACGTTRFAIWRWGGGAKPPALVRKAVNQMARRRGLVEPFPESVRKGGS